MFGVKIDSGRGPSFAIVSRVLCSISAKPGEKRLPVEIITTRLALWESVPFAFARVVQTNKTENP